MAKENQTASNRLLNPHISYEGKAEEAVYYYEKVIGGKVEGVFKYKDTPQGEQMSDEEKNLVMHATLNLKDGTSLMVSDYVPSMKMPYVKGNDITLSLHPESKDEADRLFNGLSDGGKVTMPMQDTFWNAYFGMFVDKFGVQWMINHSYPNTNK